jgi:hypothetical protein
LLQEFIPDGERVKAFVNPDDGTFGLVFETTHASDKVAMTQNFFHTTSL